MAFDLTLQPVAVGQNYLAGVQAADQQQAAQQRNALIGLQLQQQQQALSDRAATRNALSRYAQGDQTARTDLLGTPGGADIVKSLDAETIRRAQDAAALAHGVLSVPQEQRAAAYSAALQQARSRGIPVDNMPAQYDPSVDARLQGIVATGMTLDQQLKINELRKPQSVRPGGALVDNNGKELYRAPDAPHSLAPGGTLVNGSGRVIASAPDRTQPPVAVPDPTSPTGFKYVTRDQALGKPAVGPSGMAVEFDENGKPKSVMMGPGAAKAGQPVNGMGTNANNELDKQLIEMTGLRSQVAEIQRTFDPNNQVVGTKLKMALAAGKDRVGSLDPQTQQALGEYTTQRASAAQLFADRLKAMSGSAVTEQEMKRQEAYLPNPGTGGLTGIFDGDSPTEFAAKTKRMGEFFDKATARLYYVKQKGLSIDKVPLDQMPQIIRNRGNDLATQYQKQGLSGDALKGAVKQQLANEFGLVNGQ